MKKVFALLAFAAAVLVACDPNNPNNPDNPDDPDSGDYVAAIKIDGDFADWAKLPAANVATASCAADAYWTALKTVKVYADEYFIFVYFEWDKDQIAWDPDTEWVPFHIYLNGDGNGATGGFTDQFLNACADVLYEGFLTDGNNFASYDPGAYLWEGEPNGEGWSWSADAVIAAGSGLASGAGVNGKYELALVRELYPVGGKVADNFSIGFDIQQGWDSCGVLPNASVTEDNSAGKAEMLQVKTVK